DDEVARVEERLGVLAEDVRDAGERRQRAQLVHTLAIRRDDVDAAAREHLERGAPRTREAEDRGARDLGEVGPDRKSGHQRSAFGFAAINAPPSASLFFIAASA